LALHTLTLSISSYVIGMLKDAGWTPAELSLVCAGMFVPGVILGIVLWRAPVQPRGELAEVA
jgi:hypothetical protein